jgi:uncharacterized protein
MRRGTMLAALRSLACAAFVALLAGCGSSPPTRFYRLDAVEAAPPSPLKTTVRLQVAMVDVPPILDRQEKVRQNAPNSVELSDRNRCAAPLADMLRDVLTQDLISRIPRGSVALPHEPAPAAAYELRVDILEFESDTSGIVQFVGSWSVPRAGSDTPVFSRNVSLSEPADVANYSSQVKAMSTILGFDHKTPGCLILSSGRRIRPSRSARRSRRTTKPAG